MSSPPPIRDPSRLATLQRTALLDSAAEESFDRLTRLASRILNAPVSLVSLVDEDRQFFKSQCGLPEPWASNRETPLSHSFCQHAVVSREPLIIEDARQSPLRDNLAIRDLGVVAYAGIPLISSQGDALGSFCVIDQRPRKWTEDEIRILTDLAQSVMSEIELRLEVHARRAAEEERERLISRLQSEQMRLLSVFMDAPAVIGFLRGPDHVVDMANPLFLRLIGFREVIGKPIREALPEMAGQPFFDLLDQVYRTASPYVGNEFSARWDRTGSGTMAEGFFNFVYQPVLSPEGRSVDGILLHAVEVTEQVLARKQVEELAAERDAILRQIADGVIVTDSQGKITFVNEAARRIHGVAHIGTGVGEYSRAYHLFTLDGELYPPEELPLARAVLHQETVTDAEWIIRRDDGTEVIAQGSATPVLDEEGRQRGAVLTLRDVTAQRQMERQRRELLDARDTAQARVAEMLEARSRFFTAMSHELRTPINAIIGYQDLLFAGVYGELSDSQSAALQRSQGAAQHLLEMVNDILDLSKLDVGRMEIQVEEVVLDDLVEEVLGTIRPLADGRGSALHTEVEGAVRIRTDARRVRQILLNLLSNAVKFGGGQPIRLRCQPQADGGVRIAVEDRGPGIAPADLPRIFEEFVQLSHDEGGTGLGLPISRRLALRLGGSLWAESRVGEGSTFYLLLPPSAPTIDVEEPERASLPDPRAGPSEVGRDL